MARALTSTLSVQFKRRPSTPCCISNDQIYFVTYYNKNEDFMSAPVGPKRVYTAEDMPAKKAIKSNTLDFEAIEAKYNIKPSEVGLFESWPPPKNQAPRSLEEFLKLPIKLDESEFTDPQQSFTGTFETAISFVFGRIRAIVKEFGVDRDGSIPLAVKDTDSITNMLLAFLSNADVPDHWKIPKPPEYKYGICSAEYSSTQHWKGAILSILYDQGLIQGYGAKGSEWWIFP